MVTPSTTEQVAQVVRACAARRVPVVPRGAGTGLEGGAIPCHGGVVLSTERLKHIQVRRNVGRGWSWRAEG